MNLAPFFTLVQADAKKVDTLITRCLHSEISLISDLTKHLIKSGGKRLRPLIVLLSAKAFHYEGKGHLQLAASLELIHTATLLHDDVIDASELRRGKKTANSLWGNPASVLVGDFLYSRAFQLITKINNTRVLSSLARATNLLSKAEIAQLLNRYNPQLSENDYFKIIQGKTGTLFSIAAEQPAILSHCSEAEISAMAYYGLHLGTAFQLTDDTLDYCGSSSRLGKKQGNDLAEGKATLPFIYALTKADEKEALLLRESIAKGGESYLGPVTTIIKEKQAIQYAHNLAKQHIQQALVYLSKIPDSVYRQALSSLAQSSIERNY